MYVAGPLADVVKAINIWKKRNGVDLTFHGLEKGRAAWSLENCLYLAEAITLHSTGTRPASYNGLPVSEKVREVITRLEGYLRWEFKSPATPEPYPPGTARLLAEEAVSALSTQAPRVLPRLTDEARQEIHDFLCRLEPDSTEGESQQALDDLLSTLSSLPALGPGDPPEMTPEVLCDHLSKYSSGLADEELQHLSQMLISGISWQKFHEEAGKNRAKRNAWQKELAVLAKRSPKQAAQEFLGVRDPKKSPGGRPGLSEAELIYRLAKAQEALQIKAAKPKMTRKQIARAIGWRYGTTETGVRKLQYARDKLVRLQEDGDPDNLLPKVARHREETKKT